MDKNVIATEWDYIIVGTGMGGGTIGYALAKAGKKVLFLEKGADYQNNPKALKGNFLEMFAATKIGDRADDYRNAGRSGLEIWDVVKGKTLKPLLGSGTGGSSAIYGMVMERLWPHDFEPKQYHPHADKDCALPEKWPITFAELEPYYRQAEWLYGVSSTWPDPMRADQTFSYRPGPEPMPKTLRLINALKRRGYHPYLSPLALDWVPDCQFCQSFLCEKNCKNDAAKICLKPAQKNFGATLLTDCEVLRLDADQDHIRSVQARHRGEEITLKGRHVILAAGALATPLLLLQSASNIWPNGLANSSGLVGRNLMRHYIDILALFSRTPFPKHSNLKELALSDFYCVKGEKFGIVGSFGHMPPTTMVLDDIENDMRSEGSKFSSFFHAMRPLTGWFLSRILDQAGYASLILEDLPYPDNAVSLRKEANGSQMAINYRIRPSEWDRINRFRAMAKKAFAPNPMMLMPQADNLKFLAHACGTCRFGDDPGLNVLNKFNRTHDIKNLHIIDASFFPSSGGTNPGLTIAANALRVADHLITNDK
ncbi:MAG: GMC family oxidoreductase [Candidatus Omnitrophica bacterium]|nr:GMC family oxidoreductase [Candidatus Omnitrophota bacterium]